VLYDNEDNLEDLVASLMKTKAMEEGEEVCDPSSVKKNINFDEVNPSCAMDAKTLDTNTLEVPPPPPAYTNPRDRLKIRKTTTTNDLATSAASDAEDRQAQTSKKQTSSSQSLVIMVT
jgi:hypothetical protein